MPAYTYHEACDWIVTRAEAEAEIAKHDAEGGFAAFLAEVGESATAKNTRAKRCSTGSAIRADTQDPVIYPTSSGVQVFDVTGVPTADIEQPLFVRDLCGRTFAEIPPDGA
ncbi:hypothetical protein AQ610_18400 (plasmid) [Burkholderia humptydooensis]|uniref:Uncharacterized protein n=1 Tax=Burkholderia humptydooensis MSMB43 TaxID=441157 RepID=A0ABN0FYF3_9BURK|nr:MULTISPECIES: hypothetical protein [Burkholderia]ALX44527.1 hypothetical protein AQ610_18400 [Burkholderia humptydooensis]EIP85054.1 hypothetical protein A33K_18326 [Burkholderia humptydooensis MSMB43]